jgi:hypothetical protein
MAVMSFAEHKWGASQKLLKRALTELSSTDVRSSAYLDSSVVIVKLLLRDDVKEWICPWAKERCLRHATASADSSCGMADSLSRDRICVVHFWKSADCDGRLASSDKCHCA